MTNHTKSSPPLQDFSTKFVDIMIGIVLGLGFQWFPELHEPWQYIAFIFVYLNLIDYWIDYSPVVKKYPFKREFDVILHFGIIFMMFFLVYATKLSIGAVLISFIVYRLLDLVWIWRLRNYYGLSSKDQVYVNTWGKFEVLEIIGVLMLLGFNWLFVFSPLSILIGFILLRTALRVLASANYQTIYYK